MKSDAVMDEATQQTIARAIDLADQGEFRDAIELLYEVIDRHPDFENGYEMIGEYYLLNAQPDMAIRPLEIVLEMNQDNFIAHFLLGCAYGRTLLFDEALEELKIAQEMQPKDPEVLRNLGWITCMAGDLKQGRQLLLEAMKIAPQNGLIYNDLAASYLFTKSRDREKAKYWLELALKVEPDEPFIRQTYQAFCDMSKEFESIDSAL
jgi:tetratricopeptide (TPR) repeat protein